MAFAIPLPPMHRMGLPSLFPSGTPSRAGSTACCATAPERDIASAGREVPRWASVWARAFGFRLSRITAEPTDRHQLVGHIGREVVQARIQRLLLDSRRVGEPIVVMRVDIDDLGRVNEALSFAAGDAVLEAVAERIVRAVGNADNVARISGSGFVVIVPDLAEFGEDAELAHRVRLAVSDPVSAKGHVIQPTVSIGVAYAHAGMVAEHVLQQATIAVRRAKEAGGDCVAFGADGLANEAMERLELEESLRNALATDEIRPWYQPIVDFADGRILGYEALSRWVIGDDHIISPCVFIPVAECTGLIAEVDYLVLAQSLELLATLPDDQFIAVNVSPVSLTRSDFIARATVLLNAATFDLRRLHLEVTETALPSDLDIIRSAMLELGMSGAKWYFDDFGTGYSSMSNLGELPVDGLKLDMSFTRGIAAGDETSVRLAHGLLALARGLNLDTVAEGVETAETAAILREQGWSMGQGWLYGKAAPHVLVAV